MDPLPAIASVFALAALAPLVQRVLGKWTGWAFAAGAAALAVSFARRLPDVTANGPVLTSLRWVPFLDVALAFRVDGLSLLFALLVLGIGALVLAYAGGYLAGDPHIGRFYATLLGFMGAMLGLVLADDVIALFVFWELTSVTSFLLVGWKNAHPASRYAARQALLVTAGGGLALLAGLVLLVIVTGESTLSGMVASGVNVQGHALYLPTLALVALGAFTKSAQFPFHFWLPGAMAAPTPVSAYLHSATMVKAGVYLLARTFPVLGGTAEWTLLLVAAGAATMLLGAYLAVKQQDLKLVLAYSTLSALGTLVLLLGVGSEAAIEAAIVFLMAHAFYKGALFMVAGAVDHETGTRDLDVLHGLRKAMPVTALAGAIAAFSLAGLAPLFSFIGKELVLEALLVAPVARSMLIAATTIASMLLVAIALVIGVRPFIGSPGPTPRSPHEAPPALLVGPLVLSVTSLVLGLMPNLAAKTIVSPAATAILAAPVPVKLTLWHGFTPALLISIITLVGGIAIYFEWISLHRIQTALDPLLTRGPARWYGAGLVATERVAKSVTRVVQHGNLRGYVATLAGAAAALVAFGLLRGGGVDAWPWWGTIRVHEVAIAGVMVAAALVAVFARTVLAAVAAVGVVGYGVAVTFIFFGAPDLATTQALVETLVVLLFILALRGRVPAIARSTRVAARAGTAAVAIALGAAFTTLILAVRAAPDAWPRVSEAHAALSYVAAHGRNVVNVILVDFRALDTMGEITVLGVAAIGVLALLKFKPHGGDDA